MPTYSINVGTPTETTKLNNLNDVLNALIDNNSKLISPKDLRDTIFTTWENSPLKLTSITSSPVEYLGIDSTTTKSKIFLGKKQYSGLNVLNNSLLTSDTDLFIFNGRDDSNPSQNTKVRFLSGVSQSLYSVAPYIESKVLNSPDRLVLDITNDSGEINITSTNNNITLNGINFPTIASSSVALDGYVLKKSGSNLNWEPIVTGTVSNVYSSTTASIVGNPLLVSSNGSVPAELFYTNATPMPANVGGLYAGTTFSNVSFVEIFNKLLYVDLPPTVNLTFTSLSGYSGTLPSNYVVIEKRSLTNAFNGIVQYTIGHNSSNNIIVADYLNSSGISSFPSALTTPINTSISGTSSVSFQTNDFVNIVLKISDGLTGTFSATASLRQVYPFLYGWTTSSVLSDTQFYDILTKNITEKENKTIYLTNPTTHRYFYFAYPLSYGLLNNINDGTFSQIGAFTYSTSQYVSKTGIIGWTNIPYIYYRTNNLITTTGQNFNFEF